MCATRRDLKAPLGCPEPTEREVCPAPAVPTVNLAPMACVVSAAKSVAPAARAPLACMAFPAKMALTAGEARAAFPAQSDALESLARLENLERWASLVWKAKLALLAVCPPPPPRAPSCSIGPASPSPSSFAAPGTPGIRGRRGSRGPRGANGKDGSVLPYDGRMSNEEFSLPEPVSCRAIRPVLLACCSSQLCRFWLLP